MFWTGRVIKGATGVVIVTFPGVWLPSIVPPNLVFTGLKWFDFVTLSLMIQKQTLFGMRVDSLTKAVTPWAGPSLVTFDEASADSIISQLENSLRTTLCTRVELGLLRSELVNEAVKQYSDSIKQSLKSLESISESVGKIGTVNGGDISNDNEFIQSILAQYSTSEDQIPPTPSFGPGQGRSGASGNSSIYSPLNGNGGKEGGLVPQPSIKAYEIIIEGYTPIFETREKQEEYTVEVPARDIFSGKLVGKRTETRIRTVTYEEEVGRNFFTFATIAVRVSGYGGPTNGWYALPEWSDPALLEGNIFDLDFIRVVGEEVNDVELYKAIARAFNFKIASSRTIGYVRVPVQSSEHSEDITVVRGSDSSSTDVDFLLRCRADVVILEQEGLVEVHSRQKIYGISKEDGTITYRDSSGYPITENTSLFLQNTSQNRYREIVYNDDGVEILRALRNITVRIRDSNDSDQFRSSKEVYDSRENTIRQHLQTYYPKKRRLRYREIKTTAILNCDLQPTKTGTLKVDREVQKALNTNLLDNVRFYGKFIGFPLTVTSRSYTPVAYNVRSITRNVDTHTNSITYLFLVVRIESNPLVNGWYFTETNLGTVIKDFDKNFFKLPQIAKISRPVFGRASYTFNDKGEPDRVFYKATPFFNFDTSEKLYSSFTFLDQELISILNQPDSSFYQDYRDYHYLPTTQEGDGTTYTPEYVIRRVNSLEERNLGSVLIKSHDQIVSNKQKNQTNVNINLTDPYFFKMHFLSSNLSLSKTEVFELLKQRLTQETAELVTNSLLSSAVVEVTYHPELLKKDEKYLDTVDVDNVFPFDNVSLYNQFLLAAESTPKSKFDFLSPDLL